MGSASPSTTSRKPQATHPWTPGHLFQENQSLHETGVVASRPPTQSLTMMRSRFAEGSQLPCFNKPTSWVSQSNCMSPACVEGAFRTLPWEFSIMLPYLLPPADFHFFCQTKAAYPRSARWTLVNPLGQGDLCDCIKSCVFLCWITKNWPW